MEEINKEINSAELLEPKKIVLKQQNKQIEQTQVDEITIIEVFQTLWSGRKTIFKSVFIAGLFGVLYGLISPVQYETEVTLLPEISMGKGNGTLAKLGGLAALGGFNLEQMQATEAIRPDLYPDIIKSLSFGYYLMNEQVIIPETNTKVKVSEYLENNKSILSYVKKYTIGLPRLLFKSEEKSQLNEMSQDDFAPLKLSKGEKAIVEDIQKRISTEIDKKSGIISLKVKMPDPYVAANIADKSIKYLTSYVTQYRLEKAKLNLEFVRDRHSEAEAKYKKTQRELALYKDQNKNIISATARVREEMLQSDFNLAFNLYNNLSQQLEQASITVQEETPVFTILQPISIPIEKTEPRRILIIVSFLLIGFIFSSTYLIIKWNLVE